jgi:hypothetical protein
MKLDIINLLMVSAIPIISIFVWKIADKILAPIIKASEKDIKENIIKLVQVGDDKFDDFMKNTPETKEELEKFVANILRDSADIIEKKDN